MIRTAGLLFVFLSTLVGVNAQCPVADFSVSPTVCSSENLSIQNLSTGGSSYDWDFCSGDLALNPNASITVTNTLLFRTRSIRIVKDLGNWFGFTIDQASSPNRLVRFDFGTSLVNTPVVTDLGNPAGAFNGVLDFVLHKEGNNWFALVANTGANTLLKLSFGSSLTGNPTVQNLGAFGILNSPNGLALVNDNGMLHVFITNGGTSGVVHLDFGSSLSNSPAVSSFAIPGSSGPRGISITRECDRWFGLVTSYSNNKVFWIDFASGLNLAPLSGELTIFSPMFFPVNVSINLDGGEYTAFVQSAVGPMYRLSFGTSIIDKAGTGINLGDYFGATSDENSGTEWVKDGTDWYGFSIDLTNRRLYRFTFPTTCNASTKTFSGQTPPLINYAGAGANKISLLATSSGGTTHTITKTTTVTAAVAPDIDFISQNSCANHDVIFTSQNSSGDITIYDWDFGDTNSSSAQNPVHQFLLNGQYQVQLEVTAINGCKNFNQHQLTIYQEPAADFTVPAVTPICTNQNLLFDNVTIADVGSAPTWEWRVNGSLITTNEDLTQTFTSTANQEIRLKASIPGCEDEMIKNISTLVEGPVADFSFTGQCEDSDISFTNNSSGTITGFTWDFDDGQTSTNSDPAHIFSNPGTYDVLLTATNAAGCNNTRLRQVVAYSMPQVNFEALLPPFSCNGNPTLFQDLTPNPTDSNIEVWDWNFGDSGSSQNTSTLQDPQHTYDLAGTYNVSLTVSTNFSCEATLQLPVVISPSPVADFTFTAPCVDQVISFTDASSGAIESWQWQIGSTFYFTQNPTHSFNSPVSTSAVLTVEATNNCIASISKPIVVPGKLIPDFSVLRNCTGQQTLFTDITNDGADPVSSRSWDFAGLGSASGSPAFFTFSTTGNKNVTLTLTTQAGCIYPQTKSVNITLSPQANFTASPEAGAPPLAVEFTNQSSGATAYIWTFPDNSTSTEVSPDFIFQELGEYSVELAALNAQECIHTLSRTINVVSPVVDVALSGLELMEFQDGSVKPAVTIFNHGNTPLVNLGLLLDISGPIIREYVGATILPNTSHRHVMQFELPDTHGLKYLCVEADVDDITPGDNKTCSNLEEVFTSFSPYPNPATNQVQVDWIMNEDGLVNISLVNMMGQQVKNFTLNASDGFNGFTLDTEGVDLGIYLIRIKYKGFSKTYRVVVSE